MKSMPNQHFANEFHKPENFKKGKYILRLKTIFGV